MSSRTNGRVAGGIPRSDGGATDGRERGAVPVLDRPATEQAPTTRRESSAAVAEPPAPAPSTSPAPTPQPTSAPTPGPAATRPARKGGVGGLLKRLVILLLLAAALATGTIVGYRWWEDSQRYVSTDNAQIAGAMVQVGGLEAGRVLAVRYDVGDHVNQNDVVAQLTVPTAVSMLPNGTPNQQFTGTTDTMVDVRSPVTGVVVARTGNPGDTVPAGQPLLAIVDPTHLWVTANVEETQAHKLAPGQPVVVHVDNLNADLAGKVAAITQASAQSFSAIPQQNLSGNYTKVTQLQPVKIILDQTDPRLALGTSVEVKIQVAG